MRIDIPKFDEVETSMEPVPAGRYTCILEEVEKRTTKSGDSEYLAWTATILGPDEGGRKVFFNTSLKEAALWNLKSLLVAAGVDVDTQGFNTEDAIGKNVDVQVDVEEYKGRQVNRAGSNYYPPSQSQ